MKYDRNMTGSCLCPFSEAVARYTKSLKKKGILTPFYANGFNGGPPLRPLHRKMNQQFLMCLELRLELALDFAGRDVADIHAMNKIDNMFSNIARVVTYALKRP